MRHTVQLISLLYLVLAVHASVSAQSGLIGDQFTFSATNFPDSFGIVTDPETQEVTDHGTPPVTMTFDGIAETAGGLSVNERVETWAGIPGGIPAVQATGIDGENNFDLLDWENPGEVIEFSYTTLDMDWISDMELDQSGYTIAGLDWQNAEPGTMPALFETGFFFYWTRDGSPITGYSTQLPDIGLLVGAHPFDENIPEVVYIAYSASQVDDVSELREGGLDIFGGTSQLDENNGNWDLLAEVMGLPVFASGVDTPANGFHTGFLIQQPTGGMMPGLAADFNMDGMVDLADFNILKGNFGQSGATKADGDATSDGSVDLADFNVLKGSFGQSGSAVVPEPSSFALGILAALTLVSAAIGQCRRRLH